MNKHLSSTYYVFFMIGVRNSKSKYSPGPGVLILYEGHTNKSGIMYTMKTLCGVTHRCLSCRKGVVISLGAVRLPGGGDIL